MSDRRESLLLQFHPGASLQAGAPARPAPHLRLAEPEPELDLPPSGPIRIRLDALNEDPEEARLRSIPLYRELRRRGLLRIAVEAAPEAPATPPPPPPEGMAWISPRRLEILQRQIALPGFFLDRFPVTNGDYRSFLLATGGIPPAHWFGDRFPAGQERHPVTGVTLAQARRYAGWRGRRLPLAAEWLSALHGVRQTPFPWGETCDPARCNCPRAGADGTAPVDAHPGGATPEGCMDMLGNVWEWTEAGSLPPADTGTAWVLGGSFRHPCGGPQIPWSAVPVDGEWRYLGFRCAADPEAA